jgi:hypothetical protein
VAAVVPQALVHEDRLKAVPHRVYSRVYGLGALCNRGVHEEVEWECDVHLPLARTGGCMLETVEVDEQQRRRDLDERLLRGAAGAAITLHEDTSTWGTDETLLPPFSWFLWALLPTRRTVICIPSCCSLRPIPCFP